LKLSLHFTFFFRVYKVKPAPEAW